MALKATIFKASINVSDMDRQVYGDFDLTVARHPSETDERMMLRLLVFALHAGDRLELGRGISTTDEPDLWQRSLSGEVECWIDLGNPDPARIGRACGRAREVIVYAYGERGTRVWWRKQAAALGRFGNLRAYLVGDDHVRQLSAMAGRAMRLQCTIESGEAWFSDGERDILLRPESLKDG